MSDIEVTDTDADTLFALVNRVAGIPFPSVHPTTGRVLPPGPLQVGANAVEAIRIDPDTRQKFFRINGPASIHIRRIRDGEESDRVTTQERDTVESITSRFDPETEAEPTRTTR